MTVAQERIPASAMMEALWWLHHRAKNQSVYNLTWRMACDKALDLTALATAWQAVGERHEALRGSLHEHDGKILLDITDQVELPVQWLEIADPGTVPVDELLRLVAEEMQERPLALDRAPLARIIAVSVGDRHELLLTIHHALIDGWGVQLLVAELSAAYASARAGRTPSFTAEPVSLQRYVLDAQAARTDGRWDASIDYWRKELDGAATTTLIGDHGGTAVAAGGAGEMIRFEVSQEAAAAVTALAGQYFTTPFVVFLASLQTALALGGGGPDVCTGVATANRMTQQDQGLVGYVANLVLARSAVSADDTFGAVVERTRNTVWSMLAHQTVPFSLVYGALDTAAQQKLRDAIPVILTHLGPIGNGLTLGDVSMRLERAPNRAARTDLGIGVLDVDGGYLLDCEYSTGRYERRTPLRLLHDMDTILAAGGADPDRQLSTVDVRSRSGPAHLDHRAVAPTERGTGSMPHSAAMDQVHQAWASVLGAEPAGPDEDFFATGGRSLKVVQLMSRIQEATGVHLDVPQWLIDPSPRRAAEQIAGGLGQATTSSTLIDVRPGDGPHVHLIPGAGGSAQDYRALIAALPANWRVSQSQERTALDDVPAMARQYQADLDAAGVRPALLVGWSMGGQIAYEMVAGQTGDRPLVAVLDSAPPIGYDVGEDTGEVVYDTFAALMAAAVGAPALGAPARTSPGDPELTMRVLAAQLTASTGERVSSTMLTERWATFRRHTAAVASYVSAGRLDTPALVVGADLLDGQLDHWVERFGSAPAVLRVATDHYGLLREPAVSEIARAIVRLQEHAA